MKTAGGGMLSWPALKFFLYSVIRAEWLEWRFATRGLVRPFLSSLRSSSLEGLAASC
jgi:hypothetical protein